MIAVAGALAAGCARATPAALLPLLEREANRSWRETFENNVASWPTGR